MRNELRAGTKASHEKLDLYVGSLRPFESRNAYRVYLSSMHSLYVTHGDALSWASKQSDLDCPVGDLQRAIASDLDEPIDDSRFEANVAASLEQRWASAYVLEGSAMGARYLNRGLNESGLSNSYLTKLAEDSYQRWPKFVEALERADCDVEATVAAAVSVFDCVRDRFAFFAEHAGLRPDPSIS